MKTGHFLLVGKSNHFLHPSTVAEQTELLEVQEKEKFWKLVQVGYQTGRFWSMNALFTRRKTKDLQ